MLRRVTLSTSAPPCTAPVPPAPEGVSCAPKVSCRCGNLFAMEGEGGGEGGGSVNNNSNSTTHKQTQYDARKKWERVKGVREEEE